MQKLTGKSKHTVKGNHPHTNMISKPEIKRRGESNAGYWK